MTNPRYIGDITSKNWKSPRRAVIAFSVVKHNIQKKNLQIKSLRKYIQRYKNRISSLKDLVNDLKKQQLISDNGADCLYWYVLIVYN